MQDTFIQAYPKLLQPSVAVAGLWLAHGDEPLLSQWLIDALRPHWRAQNYAIKRIELVSVKSWQEVLSELGSQSLFDDASAIIVTGNHKPDKAFIAELERFAQDAQTGAHSHSLLWLTSKQDKRSQSSLHRLLNMVTSLIAIYIMNNNVSSCCRYKHSSLA